MNDLNKFINNSDRIISVLPSSNITLGIINNINEINVNEININEINVNKINENKKKYWIDLCLSNDDDIIQINNKLKNINIEYLESPVIGEPIDMKKGTLTAILNGSKNAYDNCQDIINIYANHIKWKNC